MWQEIVVGLIVAGAVMFMALRIRKNFRAAKNAEARCNCSSCTCLDGPCTDTLSKK